MRKLLVLVTLLACFPLLPGCGDEKGSSRSAKGGKFKIPEVEPVATTTISADVARLLPADTVAILYVPSARDLRTQLSPILVAAGEEDFDPFEPLRAHPGAAALLESGVVDETRPYAMAVSISSAGGMPRPVPTFVVPVADPASANQMIESMGLPPGMAAEGAIVLGDPFGESSGESPRGIDPVTFPAGMYGVHADLQTLIQKFRPFIEMGLSGFEGALRSDGGMNPAASREFAATYLNGFRAFLDSAETLSAGFAYADGGYELHATFVAREGSALDRERAPEGEDLWEIAGTLDPDSPFGMVMGFDSAQAFEWLQPFTRSAFSMYPPEVAGPLSEWVDSSLTMLDKFEGAHSISGGFGGQAMRMQVFSTARKEKQLVEDYLAFLEKNPVQGKGIDLAGPVTRESGGVDVFDLHGIYDFELLLGDEYKAIGAAEIEEMTNLLYGPDGLRMSFAAEDGIIAFLMGEEPAAVDRAIGRIGASPNALDPALARAIARVNRAPLAMAGHVDITEFMRSIARMASLSAGEGTRVLNALQSVGPTSLFAWGRGEGREFDFGLSFPAQSVTNTMMLQKAMNESGGF